MALPATLHCPTSDSISSKYQDMYFTLLPLPVNVRASLSFCRGYLRHTGSAICGVVGHVSGVTMTGGVPTGEMNSLGVLMVDDVSTTGDLLLLLPCTGSSSVSLVGIFRYPGIRRLLDGG